MIEHQIVDSSFTATINAPIEKIDIPAWCFSLPEQEYQGVTSARFRRIYDGSGRQVHVHQRRDHRG